MRPHFLFIFCLLLAACSTATPTPSPLPTVVIATVTAPVTPAVGEPSPTSAQAATTEPPTATPRPLTLVHISTEAPNAALAEQAQTFANAEVGWAYSQVTGDAAAVRAQAEAGAAIVLVEGASLVEALPAVAQAFPDTYFIGVGASLAEPLSNGVTLGESRYDQVGFMAGVMAGYATRTQRVAVVSNTNNVSDRNYRNGFLHGVRYTCTRCEVDLVDILDGSAATAAQQAAFYASLSSDVIFAPPGELGAAALQAAATNGAAVIGAETDAYTSVFSEGTAAGADKVLSSVLFSPAQAVAAALAAYRAGDPLSGNLRTEAASGALTLAPYRDAESLLSALDQREIAAVLERLASGLLDTGVDPATGEER